VSGCCGAEGEDFLFECGMFGFWCNYFRSLTNDEKLMMIAQLERVKVEVRERRLGAELVWGSCSRNRAGQMSLSRKRTWPIIFSLLSWIITCG